jgi:hypothetical protein
MTDHSTAKPCRTCGKPVEPGTHPRGGRPRLHCRACRPSATEARRARPADRSNEPCRGCGGLVERTGMGKPRVFCHTCRPPFGGRDQQRAEIALDRVLHDPGLSATHREVLTRLDELSRAGGISAETILYSVRRLLRVLESLPEGEPITLTGLRAEIGRGSARLARMALEEHGLVVDDTTPTMRIWIDRQADALPPGYREEIRAWLIMLLEGDERARPRAAATLYSYFGRVRPHIPAWSQTRPHLREVTRDDVVATLGDTTTANEP